MGSTEDRHRRRRRWLFISIAILLIIVGIVTWILKLNEFISYLITIFTILDILLVILQEILPSIDTTSAVPADLANRPRVDNTLIPLTDLMANKQSQANSYMEIEGITSAMLGLTRGRGALIVYTGKHLFASSIKLTFGFNRSGLSADIVEPVIRRRMNGRVVYICIFRELPVGRYTIRSDTLEFEEKITINAGDVKEVHWQRRTQKQNMYQHEIGTSQTQINNEP